VYPVLSDDFLSVFTLWYENVKSFQGSCRFLRAWFFEGGGGVETSLEEVVALELRYCSGDATLDVLAVPLRHVRDYWTNESI
jgi:hypothetical protein